MPTLRPPAAEPARGRGLAARLGEADGAGPVALEQLAARAAESEMIAHLLETSCLLELAKLAPNATSLGEHAQLVIEVLDSFLPMRGCELVVRCDGLPPVTVGTGTAIPPVTDDDPDPDDGVVRVALPLDGCGHGELTVALPARGTIRPEFIDAVVATLADGLAAVVRAEGLRRQVADADVERCTALLSDPAGLTDAALGLVGALAVVQGACGAVLEIDHPSLGPPLRVAASDPTRIDGDTTQHRRLLADGGAVEVEITWAGAPDAGQRSRLDGVVERAAAALARAVAVVRLQAETETDPLTGVGNRRRAERALDHAIDRLARFGEPVAVMVVDIDRFKTVNDAHGHPVGDVVLQTVAATLTTATRDHDTATRLGGDEFLVVLPGCPASVGWDLAERVHDRLDERLAALPGIDAVPTVSVGVASAETGPIGRDALVALADRALYDAKEGGRDRVAHRALDADGLVADGGVPTGDEPAGASV
ncbi:MAG TPA: GGDEF domain-containing protein [Acidimicrobiales bacterium]|nr:GGDEF domain-containing protein [Acidimicrobiales bacterium]